MATNEPLPIQRGLLGYLNRLAVVVIANVGQNSNSKSGGNYSRIRAAMATFTVQHATAVPMQSDPL